MTLTEARTRCGPSPSDPRESLLLRHEQLLRRHRAELHLAEVMATAGGISGLVRAASDLTANPLWLIDPRRRLVARSRTALGSDFRIPDVELLLDGHGPVDADSPAPVLVGAQPVRGIARRHLLVPVGRGGRLFAWLVVAEVSVALTAEETALARRVAFHLATEYVTQARVARVSWNARSSLARQLVRGSGCDDDLLAAAEYLGVQADADRVLVYLPDPTPGARDEQLICERVATALAAEVLATRGSDGAILLVEAPDDAARVTLVQRVKRATQQVLTDLGEPAAVAGVSTVSRPAALQRAYREAREVVGCVDRFARNGCRVIAVDDLGAARLFVANGDVGSVRRYVGDVLGPLLGDGSASGHGDLLRTLHCFFDTGRSVRESATRLGIHENTVRLRLAKVQLLTGLDVGGDANDQLSVQTALLVLRLEGHPAMPPFEEATARERTTEEIGDGLNTRSVADSVARP